MFVLNKFQSQRQRQTNCLDFNLTANVVCKDIVVDVDEAIGKLENEIVHPHVCLCVGGRGYMAA